MKSINALLVLLFCSMGFAEPETFKGLIEIENGRSIYVDWKKAAPGAPTVILLNGLTYTTESWTPLVIAARSYPYGILRYDPRGMGKTLNNDGPVKEIIRIEDQARDLDLLTRKLGLTGKLNLVGLSYGGGLATAFAEQFPQRIQTAILIAPFTEPMESQDRMIRQQIATTRILYPYNKATDEELYVYFLRQNVYYVYPLTEPSMLEDSRKPEAVFQMTQGIRLFDAMKASQKFPKASVHLMIAAKDQYIGREVLERFWRQLPKSAQASKVVVLKTEHKVPEAQPVFTAAWVNSILTKQVGLHDGRSFIADPFTGHIENDGN